jgi:hypothetical protein
MNGERNLDTTEVDRILIAFESSLVSVYDYRVPGASARDRIVPHSPKPSNFSDLT